LNSTFEFDTTDLPIYLPIHLPTYLSTYIPIYIRILLPTYASINLYTYLPTDRPICAAIENKISVDDTKLYQLNNSQVQDAKEFHKQKLQPHKIYIQKG